MTVSQLLFDAQEALNDRLVEVDLYFGFISAIIREDGILHHRPGGAQAYCRFSVGRDLELTLMSIGYIVLYNLVESTVRNYVDSIYKDMVQKGVRIEQTKETIRKLILNGFKTHMAKEYYKEDLTDLSAKIINCCWNSDSLFSGNVDLRKIKEISADFGFRLPRGVDPCSSELLKVKANRNYLAHGKKSFRECVQNDSIDEIIQAKSQISTFLKALARHIEVYIVQQKYLLIPLEHVPANSPQ